MLASNAFFCTFEFVTISHPLPVPNIAYVGFQRVSNGYLCQPLAVPIRRGLSSGRKNTGRKMQLPVAKASGPMTQKMLAPNASLPLPGLVEWLPVSTLASA